MAYPNAALTAVCIEIEQWNLSPDEVRDLIADILLELASRAEERAEEAGQGEE